MRVMESRLENARSMVCNLDSHSHPLSSRTDCKILVGIHQAFDDINIEAIV
jgi:hypothetical protein